MHNYKGNLRRQNHDYTPTKSSWEQTRQNPPPQQRYEPKNDYRHQPRNETRYDSRNEIKNQSRYDAKYQKSQLSYYQSQASRVYYDYDHSQRPSTKSQIAYNDEKYFYNNAIPVAIKSFERQDYQLRLRVQIQGKVDKGQHYLTIYLTDDNNPKFLWTFSVKEMDFLNLKSEQKLKVTYSGFPEMLQNCLKDCQQSDIGENRSNYLVLSMKKGGEGKLSFIQSNRYKESTHLQLNFKQASDQQIKQYLSNKLIQANSQIEQQRSSMRNMENVLGERMKEIQRMNSDLNSVLAQRDHLREQHKLQINKKSTELQSIKLNQLTKTKKESELQIKQLKQKLNSQIQTLTKNKNDLTNRLSQTKQKLSILQSTQRDQSIKILRLQQDLTKSTKQSDQLRNENRQLSQRRFQNQKSITELTCKIESLRSELQDKKTIINSTVQLKETNNNQISALEQLSNDQKKQIQRLQNKITELSQQNSKLDGQNAELLQKIARRKEKIQQIGQIVKDQERQLKELKKSQSILQRQNERIQYQKQEKENKIKNLQDQLQKMQKKFEDQQAMVAYLQKSLNERPGLRTPAYYPTTNSYQPSMSYSGINREMPSQLSTNSNVGSSRIALTNNQKIQKTEKYQPNIRRYEDRSKSPIITRLPQQKDPQQEEDSYTEKQTKFQKPYPVKFKMSQPKET